MNKNLKKILCGTLLTLCLSGVATSARSIGTFTSFELPKWQGVVRTINREKCITNAPWVLNITNLENASSVHTYLENTSGERRSDYVVQSRGRNEINCWGTGGYYYRCVLMNGSSSKSAGYLSGSWSPDNR